MANKPLKTIQFPGLSDTYTIPTKVTDLSNDANYATSSQVSSAIASAIGGINQFDVAVVTALPTQNIKDHTIYFVAKDSSENDVYDEFMYINSAWEHIGSTAVDLTGYATESYVDAAAASVSAAIPSTASDVGISTYVSSFNGSSGAITYSAPVSSVNGKTGAVTVDKIRLTAPTYDSVSYALVGTNTSIDYISTNSLYPGQLLTFTQYSATQAALSIGNDTNKAFLNLYNKGKACIGVNSGEIGHIYNITFQAASGTVAFLSDIPQSLPESDPVFVASAAYGITSADISSWTAKPTTDTTYSVSMSSNRITLTSSAGDSSYVDLPIYDGTVEDPEEEEEP